MTPRINTTDYVRPTTAARILGVGRARVDQLLNSGQLPSVEIDGVRFLPRKAVEKRAGKRPPG
jgi:hypothetical protein